MFVILFLYVSIVQHGVELYAGSFDSIHFSLCGITCNFWQEKYIGLWESLKVCLCKQKSTTMLDCWCLKVQYFIYCLCVGHGHGQGPGHGHGYWRVWVTWRVMILTRYDINASGYWRVGIMTRHCPSRICRLKQWRCDVNFSRMTTTGGRQIKSYWNYITIDKYIIKVWFVKCSVQPS